jgi:protein-tyrosine phosphatase
MLNRFSLLSFAMVLAGSAVAAAEVTDLVCIQTAPTEYRLSYKVTGDTHEVEVFASINPSGLGQMHKILKTSQTDVTVHAGSPGQRMYFFLKPDQGKEREVSIRHLALEGTPNFRDVGGYETQDGRFVRWGLLYRSGVLTGLTTSDLAYLAQLDVKVVCDFRTPQENSVSPEKWIDDPAVVHVADPIGSGGSNKSVSMKELLGDNPTPQGLRYRMQEFYRRTVVDATPQYALAFRQLVDGRLPMLYHCTAGKDRTGIFTALVLRSLNVPETTVESDYQMTEKYLYREGQIKMAAASAGLELAKLTPEEEQVLMAADPECIRAAMKAIDEKYGSFDNFRREALHVSDEDLEKVKSKLLTE